MMFTQMKQLDNTIITKSADRYHVAQPMFQHLFFFFSVIQQCILVADFKGGFCWAFFSNSLLYEDSSPSESSFCLGCGHHMKEKSASQPYFHANNSSMSVFNQWKSSIFECTMKSMKLRGIQRKDIKCTLRDFHTNNSSMSVFN